MINKKDFLNEPVVKQYCDYLYSNFFQSESIVKKYIEEYKWPLKGKSHNFDETYNMFEKWRKELNFALDKNDKPVALSICKDILNWGGGGVKRNIPRIEDKSFNLVEKLTRAREFIESENIDLTSFDLPMNSGFSKIYTMLNKDFIIYDSRVANQMCKMLKECFKANPVEIKLGKCASQSKSFVDPGKEFPMLTGNPKRYFESNIKAAWILGSLTQRYKGLGFENDKTLYALQTVLFVTGDNNTINFKTY